MARVALSRMSQDRGEPVRAFAARLHGEVEVCRFTKKCAGCDRILIQMADQLCIGLADAEIQEDLLKHPDQDMGVEDTIHFVEVRAAGKRSAALITTPTSTSAIDDDEGGEAISSAYRRQQKRPTLRPGPVPGKATPTLTRATHPCHTPTRECSHPNPRNTSTRGQSQSLNRTPRATPNNRGICNYCGLHGHGEQECTAHRRIHCPAYGTTCSSCGRQNHTAQMCWQPVEHESAIFEQVNTMVEGTLHHQTWDPTSQLWTQRKSPPQPHIDVSRSALVEEFRHHGHTLRTETHNLVTTAMADTGCQSFLACPGLLSSLRLTASDLIPVNLIMHSASGTNMPIMGAAIIRIRVNPTGPETRQMVYFSEIANKLYLSLATCTDLGLIPKDFPCSTPMSPLENGKAARIAPGTPPGQRQLSTIGNPASAPHTARPGHPWERARLGDRRGKHAHTKSTSSQRTYRPDLQINTIRQPCRPEPGHLSCSQLRP